MSDRSSSEKIGEFTLSVDRDHRGRFRGHQEMNENYRGWHYHIEHPLLSQKDILTLLSQELEALGAAKVEGTTRIEDEVTFPNQTNALAKEISNLARKIQYVKNLKDVNIQIAARKHVSRKTFEKREKYLKYLNGVGQNDQELADMAGKLKELKQRYSFPMQKPVKKQINPEVAVGNANEDPEIIILYTLGDASTVLWISAVTHTLHVEANKKEAYAKSII